MAGGQNPIGGRATPNFSPAPNSQPTGAKAGVPPRTQLFRRDITGDVQEIVAGTSENRIVTLTAPVVGFAIYAGTDSNVSPRGPAGVALPAGLAYTVTLIGFQELYAITDSPDPIPLQIQVSIILMAERERTT